jgi:hypothetical protein
VADEIPPFEAVWHGRLPVLKDLKQSTRQRFVAIEFDYPAPELEQKIIERESGVDAPLAAKLVRLAEMNPQGQRPGRGRQHPAPGHAAGRGKPDDHYDCYRGEYGIEDTRQALIDARRRGIYPFCITIDREARD